MNENNLHKGIALLIENNPYLRTIFQNELLKMGYRVSALGGEPKELNKYYNKKRFDLLMINGLGEDCFNTLKEINATDTFFYSRHEKIIDEAKKKGIEVHVGIPNAKELGGILK